MEQKRKTPWKLVLLISLALLPVGILAIAGRASDALSVPGAAAHQAAPAKAATNDLDFLSEMSKTNPAPEGIPWVRLIVGVLAVAMLIGVGIYMIKKANGGAIPRRGDRHVQVLETRSLGRKAQLHLVSVGGRALLLTSAGENVTKLAEFPEEDLVAPENAASRVDAGTRTANKLSFKTIVKSMIESCGSLAHIGSSQRPREQTSDLDSAGDQQ